MTKDDIISMDENVKLYDDAGTYMCTVGEMAEAMTDYFTTMFMKELPEIFKDIKK